MIITLINRKVLQRILLLWFTCLFTHLWYYVLIVVSLYYQCPCHYQPSFLKAIKTFVVDNINLGVL